MTSLYYIAIILSEASARQITEVINSWLTEETKLEQMPHITLFQPFQIEFNQELNIIEKLINFGRLHNSFIVKAKSINNFSNRIIYLEVEKTTNILYMQQDLATLINQEDIMIKNYKTFDFTPHITLLKAKSEQDFISKWEIFSQLSFELSLNVFSFHLLKFVNNKWISANEVVFNN